MIDEKEYDKLLELGNGTLAIPNPKSALTEEMKRKTAKVIKEMKEGIYMAKTQNK
jgi:hypothetical protein